MWSEERREANPLQYLVGFGLMKRRLVLTIHVLPKTGRAVLQIGKVATCDMTRSFHFL